LGFSANQGSSTSRLDQVEAFDIPTTCQTAIKAPIADFTSDVITTCHGTVRFTDQSVDVPQAWLWNFGDGSSDTVQNPTHTYSASGTYNVSLAVYNTLGGDTIVKASLISVVIPSPPTTVTNGSGCSNDSIVLMAAGNGTIGWFNATNSFLATGNTFKTPPSLSSATFYAKSGTVFPKNKVGPQNSNLGTGGYHNNAFTGTVNFEAYKKITIHSAWVDAGSTGPRTISLWAGNNAACNVLQTITVNIPFTGPGRIDLGFEVPAAGTYSIGLSQADLYRNNSGATYPYDIAGLISLTGSPAGANDFYYYLYDLEVSETACWSDSVPVVATVTDTADFSFSTNDLAVNFTDLTPRATSWAWSFGDGNTSSIQNPAHFYRAAGVYNVSLSVNGGTCIVTYPVTVNTNIGLNEAVADALGLKLYPNPAYQLLNIEFSKPLGYPAKGRI
jgi:PKD repeat protein